LRAVSGIGWYTHLSHAVVSHTVFAHVSIVCAPRVGMHWFPMRQRPMLDPADLRPQHWAFRTAANEFKGFGGRGSTRLMRVRGGKRTKRTMAGTTG
jgi:hypothetical protein